jgi:hypothetical protein
VAQEAKADVTVICGATTSTEGMDRVLGGKAMGSKLSQVGDPWYDYDFFNIILIYCMILFYDID